MDDIILLNVERKLGDDGISIVRDRIYTNLDNTVDDYIKECYRLTGFVGTDIERYVFESLLAELYEIHIFARDLLAN